MLKALKIAAGSGIAIVAAEFLQLSYATSAGIITLLTVQDTRQDTIQLTVDRIMSFLLCVCMFSFSTGRMGELYRIYPVDGSMLLSSWLAEHDFGQCGNGYTLSDDTGL